MVEVGLEDDIGRDGRSECLVVNIGKTSWVMDLGEVEGGRRVRLAAWNDGREAGILCDVFAW